MCIHIHTYICLMHNPQCTQYMQKELLSIVTLDQPDKTESLEVENLFANIVPSHIQRIFITHTITNALRGILHSSLVESHQQLRTARWL